MTFSKTAIGRLRLIGIAEGISFIVLLFISMPIKYIAHIPEAVKYNGWIHGILFVLYVYALINASIDYKWPLKKSAMALLASLVPFGTFVYDKQLKLEEAALVS
jgi:integral membrane protein